MSLPPSVKVHLSPVALAFLFALVLTDHSISMPKIPKSNQLKLAKARQGKCGGKGEGWVEGVRCGILPYTRALSDR